MKAIAVVALEGIRDGTAVGMPRLYHSLRRIFTFKGLRHANVLL